MKYSAYAAFEKHLNDTIPHHPALVYMLVVPCAYERKLMAQFVAGKLQKQWVQLPAETSWDAVFEQLHTSDLFGSGTGSYIYWDGVDAIKDKAPLIAYVQKPSPGATLCLGAGQMQAVSDLYNKGKKEMVVLDLSQEKPWDRQRRLNDFLVAEAAQEGKHLQSGVFASLWQRVGPDLSTLQQELRKLSCYVGEKKEISLADVEAISVKNDLSSSWQLAESLLFEGKAIPKAKSSDLGFTIALVGQIRYLLHTGIKIGEAISAGEPPESVPQVKPAALQKYLACLRSRKLSYFSKAIPLLYACEMELKSSSIDSSIVLDNFLGELQQL